MTFTMWSLGHYLFILSPFVFWMGLHFLLNDKPEHDKRKYGVLFSVIGIVILLFRNIEIFVLRGFVFHFELVPLQICHFANFVLLFAFLKNNKTLFAFAWLFNLPAAFMSIVFANGLENYATLVTFQGFAYISGHMLIVSLTLWAFSSGFVVLSKRILYRLYVILVPLYVLAHGVNLFFRAVLNSDSNYFYTMRPESGTPLELFYTMGTTYQSGALEINPVYLALTGIFGLVVTLIMFLLTFYAQKTEEQLTSEQLTQKG